MLTNEVLIAPNGGKEFGPQHLDFHPTKPWMYVSIETQNKMYMYRIERQDHPEITYRSETLAEPNNIRARQAAGTADVHPNGSFVYGLYILRMELPDFVKRLSRIEVAGAKAEFVQALKEAKEQAEALETPEATSALLGHQSGRTSLAASHCGDSPTVGSRLPRVARGH